MIRRRGILHRQLAVHISILLLAVPDSLNISACPGCLAYDLISVLYCSKTLTNRRESWSPMHHCMFYILYSLLGRMLVFWSLSFRLSLRHNSPEHPQTVFDSVLWAVMLLFCLPNCRWGRRPFCHLLLNPCELWRQRWRVDLDQNTKGSTKYTRHIECFRYKHRSVQPNLIVERCHYS